MFKLAICDDEYQVHESIKNKLQMISEQTNLRFDIHSFYSGEELLAYYEKQLVCV